MAPTYHDLKLMTVAQLRDMAKGLQHEAVQGYSQMNKDHLLPAICKALGIDTMDHHMATGIDKPAIKQQMRDLKKQRDEALVAHDSDALHRIRRERHRLNRQIRAHLA